MHVVAEPGINVLKLGAALQTEITRALEEMIGMSVTAVDVHVDDVARAAPKAD